MHTRLSTPAISLVRWTYQRPFSQWLDSTQWGNLGPSPPHLRQAVRRQQTQADKHRRQTPTITPDNGCGSPHVIFACAFPVASSAPGTWVLIKSDDKLHQCLLNWLYLIISVFLPLFMCPSWNLLMILRRGQRNRRRRRAPYPSQWKARRYTRSENFSIPGAGAAFSSTWSTGRVTARRKGLGSTQRIFWTPAWWRISTETTRNDRPPDHAVDLGADHLLASGAARRGGALLQRASLWLPLRAIRGNLLLSIRFTLHFPSLPRTCCWSVRHHLQIITWTI